MNKLEKKAKELKKKSMTKKALAAAYAENRSGQRIPQGRPHKSKKDFDRKKLKRELRQRDGEN